MKNSLFPLLEWIITFSLPFLLIMTAIRLLITPLYPIIEYRMPGFPQDPYGFTLQDRLKWSMISIDYLLNDAGLSFLADQHLDDGSPLYNERELGHMQDVRILVQRMIIAWWGLLTILVGLGLWAWRGQWQAGFWKAISRGGWLTIVLVFLILFGVAINFDWLFTNFHRIFFTGDTWIFLYSDTLIRLFPIRFWQDGFTAMGIFTLAAGLASGLLGRHWADQKTKRVPKVNEIDHTTVSAP